MKVKLAIVSLAAACTLFVLVGCSGRHDQMLEQRKEITMVESSETDFVQTGYTDIYNPSGSNTQLITLYDKRTGVEYIMLRNGEMTSIQPRISSDGNILLHKAEEK
jgi:uncharacterized protein YcfL